MSGLTNPRPRASIDPPKIRRNRWRLLLGPGEIASVLVFGLLWALPAGFAVRGAVELFEVGWAAWPW